MRISWKLGRVAGIKLYLHPTFLLVLLPGITPFSPLLTLSLFGCVLLHELGHAFMARQFGIETLDITLYPIGGVARLERMPRAPGAELLIALAGPAVNFAIVAALLGLESLKIGGFESGLGRGSFFGVLMLANLVLGAFNLIPAFPMDGGRVLRALLSGWLGRIQATSIAASIGRGLALLFGIYSFLNFAAFPQNLIHVGLAAFIYAVAGAEEASVLAEERRRAYYGSQSQSEWAVPPGYHWVRQSTGDWQLAPIVVPTGRSWTNSASWNG